MWSKYALVTTIMLLPRHKEPEPYLINQSVNDGNQHANTGTDVIFLNTFCNNPRPLNI